MLYQAIRKGCELYHKDKRGPGYDKAYNAYFNNIKPSISNLITFLSSWGCRKATSILTSDLKPVLQEVVSLLEPLRERELTILTIRCDEDFSIVENAYRKLLGVYNVSSTSASKILHTIHPELLVPWDYYISREYAFNDNSKEYAYRFIPIVQREANCAIVQVKERQGEKISSADAIHLLKSCHHDSSIESSPLHPLGLVKVLDEYNFMKYTRNHLKLAD